METMPLMHHHPGRIVMEVSNEFNESDKSPHPQNKSSMAKMNMKVTRREATHARVYDDCVPAISHFRVVAHLPATSAIYHYQGDSTTIPPPARPINPSPPPPPP
jgi:hypothetical protein